MGHRMIRREQRVEAGVIIVKERKPTLFNLKNTIDYASWLANLRTIESSCITLKESMKWNNIIRAVKRSME